MTQTYRRKLIEVALPLDKINAACQHETSVPRKGHPSTFHLWWARRPLAACRAVIFASLVDDPSEQNAPKDLLDKIDGLPKPSVLPSEWEAMSEADQRREKLFEFIGELVKWENTTNEVVIGKAKELVEAAAGGALPPIVDPFCGRGIIPLEGQRLGLDVVAGDLNPVAVLITKALVEIPPKFRGQPPVNPQAREIAMDVSWTGAAGLAQDVRYYGEWVRDRALGRIGHLYASGPKGEPVIAWLWARTVRCPNPACGAEMPLLTTYVLSSRKGRERYLHPKVTKDEIRFDISTEPPAALGDPKAGAKRGVSGRFECLVCGEVTSRDYVSSEAKAGRLGVVQTAVVVKGPRGRQYLPASDVSVPEVQLQADVSFLEPELAANPRDIWCRNFGLTRPLDLFTPRQLATLITLSALIDEARQLALEHAVEAGRPVDEPSLDQGGKGARAYAEAIATYLAFVLDKAADWGSSLCSWIAPIEGIRSTFARQALPMVWDFAETNPLGEAAGNWMNHTDWVASMIEAVPVSNPNARCVQQDAAQSFHGSPGALVVTDPPYYNNIGYADLSDFFYVWLRRTLAAIYPELLSTVLTPKTQELVALAYRFQGDKRQAERHFEDGLVRALTLARDATTGEFPVSLYYAFKQAEATGSSDGRAQIASTGWQTMLDGVLKSGLQIVGTWPMRTERSARPVSLSTNALASSVVLACRPLPTDAPLATRREFQARLHQELPDALLKLTGGHIAPVDLAQSAIGPGMAVFSSYTKVVEADGSEMSVRTALGLINEAIEDYFAEQEGALDQDTQFCVRWFEQHGLSQGPYGDAENMARAKNIGVEAMARNGVLESKGGKVRLFPMSYYEENAATYDPAADKRPTVWEACHYLGAALQSNGEVAAARLARRLGGLADEARDLAYRLYDICDRKGWAEPALGYNALVASWPEIQKQAAQLAEGEQAGLI